MGSISIFEDPHQRHDWTVIGLVGIGHAGSHFSHLLLPLMFPLFAESFGIGFAKLGLTVTLFFVVSGVGQALSGFLVDRIGAVKVLLASLLCLSWGCVVASQAQGHASLMVAAFFLGLGNCSFHPVDFSILNHKVSPERMGYAYSAHGLCGNLGWALAPVFMLSIAQTVGWRWSYLAAGLLFASLFVLLWVTRDRLQIPMKQEVNQAANHQLDFLRHATVWWCFAFFVLSTMTLAVIQSFGVSILNRLHGVSLLSANAALTGYMLCAALGMLLGGVVSTHYKARSDLVVAVCMVTGALLIALSVTEWIGPIGSMVVFAIAGLAIGIGGPSRDLLIRSATPKGATGRVYGMVYSGLDVGFAIAPVAFGLLMDRGQYATTLLLAALTLLVSVGCALGVGATARSIRSAPA